VDHNRRKWRGAYVGRVRRGRPIAAISAVLALAISSGVLATGPVSTAQASPRRVLYPAGLVSPIRGMPQPSASVPKVTGPIPGIPPQPPEGAAVSAVTPAVLTAYGYQEHEFFVSGKANAYVFSGHAGSNGRWRIRIAPGTTRFYRTRIVVFTPMNHSLFNGTVVVEWDNVTVGLDLMPDLIYDHGTPFRDGDAYVGVSAQFVGVEAAKLNDPARYGSLVHPGDSYSYDIFSQAGMAIWRDWSQVLGGLRPRALIADGESQSAARMVTYVDAFAPVFNVYDGYLIHSRGSGGTPLQQGPGTALVVKLPSGTFVSKPDGNRGLTNVNTPAIVASRTDLLAPVLTFETQTDVYAPPYGLLSYGPATQADSPGFRLWEVAGTAHADDCLANLCAQDTGNIAGAIARFNAMLNPPTTYSVYPPCDKPINTGEEGYTLGAALQQLTRWVLTGGANGGIAASMAPLFAGQSVGEGSSTVPVLDAFGNVVGGVRSPAVDVPVATLTGVPNSPLFCVLAGTTVPLPAATLHRLYPTHAAFFLRWTIDVIRLTIEGYLTVPDALNLVAAAQAAAVPPS
jgi:Alpha/beta hydrolase domain